MEDDRYLMWLLNINGVGIKRQKILLNYFKTAKNLYFASASQIKTVDGISSNIADRIENSKKTFSLDKFEENLYKKGINFISQNNKIYPKLLSEIVDAPLAIYVLGNLPKEEDILISIIGSRKCSEYGITMAYKLSKDLSKNNITIVSGMAKGIDSIAHKGAMSSGGKTVAILGCGIDICYPAQNYNLRNEIIENGCIISEYPPGTPPMQCYFPARNRIISGLSRAIIVVEASIKSGTIITVEQALEQGRDVFAVPGNANSKLSEGTNNLIKQGAPLVSSYEDVISELGLDIAEKNQHIENISFASDEKLVYDCISIEPIEIDRIVLKLNMQINTIQYILTMLELKGCITRLPGQRYIRSL